MFAANGLAMGAWAPQIPPLMPKHQIGESVLGLVILCFGLGAVTAMLVSGSLIARYGGRAVLRGFAFALIPTLPMIVLAPSLPLLVIAALLFGAVAGSMDVAMNAVAVQVEAVPGEVVLVCNDARMGEVYWGVFRRDADGLVSALAPESVSAPDSVGEGAPRAAHAAGNALARYPALAARLAMQGLRLHEGLLPRADAIAVLGARVLAAGQGLPADLALPVYVRDDVARPPGGSVTGMQ